MINCLAQEKFILSGTVPPAFNNLAISLLIKDDIGRYTEQTFTKTVKDGKFLFGGTLDNPTKNTIIEIQKGKEKKYLLHFSLDTGLNELSIKIKDSTNRILSIAGKLSLSNIIRGKLDSLRRAVIDAYRAKNRLAQSSVALPVQEGHQLDLDMLKVIQQYPDNYYALTRLYQLSKHITMLNYGELIIIALNSFSKHLQSSQLGIEILENQTRAATATQASRIGRQMFDFELKNVLDGKVLSNKDLANRPYILAFSATWCIPCHEQLPTLKAIYEKYKGNGLEVVYYNQDDNFKEWDEDVRKNNLTWRSISESKSPNSLGMKLAVHYIPTYLIVNKNGLIIYNSDQMDVSLKLLEDYIKKAF